MKEENSYSFGKEFQYLLNDNVSNEAVVSVARILATLFSKLKVPCKKPLERLKSKV